MKLFKRAREAVVEFCDRCARVCDDACRVNAIRQRSLDQVLRVGVRL